MRSALLRGTKRSRTDSESVAMEKRDMVSGIKAIWRRLACIKAKSRGGPMRLSQ